MTELAHLSSEDRRELFRRAASHREGPADAVMVEKDYWVCWTIGKLFGAHDTDEIVPGLVFKGGTSLSKVYAAIDRFSEDIDLTIPRTVVGIEAVDDLTAGISSTQARHRLDKMVMACSNYVETEIRTKLAASIAADLDGSDSRVAWTLEPDATDRSTLLLSYPASLESGEYGIGGYIRPSIRLEFGLKNEPWPAHVTTITPYARVVVPTTLSATSHRVRVLDGERTFWEKATILHHEAHRKERKSSAGRISRHYSDLAALADHELGERALENVELLRAVALHKASYFRTPWARYEDAAIGDVRLIPSQETLDALRIDYSRMREMFFQPPPPFEDVIARLRTLELEIRAAAVTLGRL